MKRNIFSINNNVITPKIINNYNFNLIRIYSCVNYGSFL